MIRNLFVLVSLCVLLVGGLSAFAQDDAPVFSVINENRIVERGSGSLEWDITYTDPGAVAYHDGQFHMIRNGFNGWPASVQMGYLVSEDGANWTEPQSDPILLTANVPFARRAALASGLVVTDDGTWMLYFYTWNTFTGANGESEIGLATASDPLGPWIVLDTPVLTPDTEAGETAVSAPEVVRVDDGYVMYYNSYDTQAAQSIHRATSTDGIIWEKNNEPVITPSQAWEGDLVHQARVMIAEDGTWVMIYRGQVSGALNMRLGLATSTDGINWAKADANPIFEPADIPSMLSFWFHNAVLFDEAIYLYVEATPGAGTDIYALRAEVASLLALTEE